VEISKAGVVAPLFSKAGIRIDACQGAHPEVPILAPCRAESQAGVSGRLMSSTLLTDGGSRPDILLQRKHMEWIAIGVFAEVGPLIAAITELVSLRVPWADLCLAGAPASMGRLAAAPHVRDIDGLTALLHGLVEATLPTFEPTVLAVAGCPGNVGSLVSADMAERLRGPIINGCILLGASAAGGPEAARIARALLRHSSHYVHVFQGPPKT
jgi:hypothetical protein